MGKFMDKKDEEKVIKSFLGMAEACNSCLSLNHFADSISVSEILVNVSSLKCVDSFKCMKCLIAALRFLIQKDSSALDTFFSFCKRLFRIVKICFD